MSQHGVRPSRWTERQVFFLSGGCRGSLPVKIASILCIIHALPMLFTLHTMLAPADSCIQRVNCSLGQTCWKALRHLQQPRLNRRWVGLGFALLLHWRLCVGLGLFGASSTSSSFCKTETKPKKPQQNNLNLGNSGNLENSAQCPPAERQS